MTAATEATNHWLAIVDAGNFADSWKNTAQVIKLGVTETDWVVDLDAIRGKVGKTTMRELKTAEFSTTVRGAPSTGEYVTILYLTKFANAPLAMETLVVTQGSGRRMAHRRLQYRQGSRNNLHLAVQIHVRTHLEHPPQARQGSRRHRRLRGELQDHEQGGVRHRAQLPDRYAWLRSRGAFVSRVHQAPRTDRPRHGRHRTAPRFRARSSSSIRCRRRSTSAR